MFPFFILPSTIMATVRPAKKRRTGYRPPPMVEGSDLSFDTAMYIQSKDGQRILVPIRPDAPDQACKENDIVADPESDYFPDFHQPDDIEMQADIVNTPPSRNRWFYMKEFVARAGDILQAIQAREALPSSSICTECAESTAYWRCSECVGQKLLCRFCMRCSHFSNPFHRIECWTGTHFRKAALWEVGVYLTLPHQNGGICPNLLWQKQMLEKFQKKKDVDTQPRAEDPIGCHYPDHTDPGSDHNGESA